jgi:hypothetical protein
VVQFAGVQVSLPLCTQKPTSHAPPAQSVAVAHGAPPGSPHVPALQTPVVQSLMLAHVAHTFAAQLPVTHETGSMHGSPTASLHCPAAH